MKKLKVIGHRGAGGLAPENTIASLHKALEYGVDALEIDLRVTKDNIVVLHHDPELTDLSGAKVPIASNTFDTLKSHKPDLATFEEALSNIDPLCCLCIEVKPGVNIRPIVSLIRSSLNHERKPQSLRLRSFEYRTLKALHVELPDLPIDILEKFSGLRAVSRAKRMGTKSLAIKKLVLWPGTIKYLSNRGYELYAYTVNDPELARRWHRYGMTGVVTDYPDRFLSVSTENPKHQH